MFGSVLSRSKTPGRRAVDHWPTTLSLLNWAKKEPWTLGQALAGTAVLGATGSGKSSTTGKTLAMAYLKAGFGGLVCTAKPDECDAWESYCAQAGRLKDLMFFGHGQPWRFNFLDYELRRVGSGAGITENLVQVLLSVLELGEHKSSGGGGGEDASFFANAKKQILRAAIDVLVLAKGRITVSDIYRLIISGPTSPEQLAGAEWKERSFCFQCLQEADRRPKSAMQRDDFALATDFWLIEFVNLSPRTRASIVSTVTGTIDILQRGLLRELLCGETNITPMAAADGKIIVLNMSTKEFCEVGQMAQVVFKTSFQRAIERRNVLESPRPVFLFMDEFQNFLTSYDTNFATTCRSARVATTLLTQNLPVVYAALGGGEKARVDVDGLLGNMNLKVLHANGDRTTNEAMSNIIGRSRQTIVNASQNYSQNLPFGQFSAPHEFHGSAGVSEVFEHEVGPVEFTKLRTGGPGANKFLVDAILFASGVRFRTSGKPWMRVTFSQK